MFPTYLYTQALVHAYTLPRPIVIFIIIVIIIIIITTYTNYN
jgi:hypothetical protein